MTLKNKNILITGISGFVGSRMAKLLLDQNNNVFGLYRRRADGIVPVNLKYQDVIGDVTLLESDLLDISSIAAALDRSKPDYIFHLAAQSFIPRSFSAPVETMSINCGGTSNLLEAIRYKSLNPAIVFAGTSEEYGLVFYSDLQYKTAVKKYGAVFPDPSAIPELPIKETNPLRPMSPYAVSKVYGDFLMRNYHASFGMRTMVSRGFNHEGAGRGIMFVTSAITKQVMQYKRGEIEKIKIGNINAFRDWSHVDDILQGYFLLAEKGRPGEVYNQGSQRTNSVLSYLLLCLEAAGYKILKISTYESKKIIENPAEINLDQMFGFSFEKTRVDKLMLEDKLQFELSDRGIIATTDKGEINIDFDEGKFRPAEVPILLTNTEKIRSLGFSIQHGIKDIITDQLNYYLDPTRSPGF